ncbi:CHAP domain-containing protein [Nonomuraea sp. NPDC005692]|uniref:CHAP domain-containing protein n=1 Tax=Nonomuraea sp. NPDC005692 TaxID=3157168 RepID=UPI0033FFD795
MGHVLRKLVTIMLALSVIWPLSLVSATTAVADAGPFKAKVDIDGRGSMDPDDRVSTDAYLADADVTIVCQDTGPAVGGSAVWDYTTKKVWVPDTYVRTGIDGFLPDVPRCLSIGIDGYANKGSLHGPYRVKVDLDGRGSANPDDRVRIDAYMRDSQILIKCQDYGGAVNGSTLWDYTSQGLWVPDVHISTGTTGWIPGMPSCSSLGIPGGGGTQPGGGRQFPIRTTLNGYHGKSLSSAREEDKYSEESYITIVCQAYGETNYGGSTVWDKTVDGLWVADYYVRTGSTDIVMNRCDNDGPSGGGGNRYLVRTTLNGYHGKSLSSAREEDRYAGNSYIAIVCQAYGEFNYGGSAVWDKTSDGLWVADYYVKTGSSDIVLPRCDNDPKPAGGGGGTGNPGTPMPPGSGTVDRGNVRDQIVRAAYSQLGVAEWGDNCNPYGSGGSVKCGWAWCSMFASWTWRHAGIDVFLPYSGDFYWWGKSRGTLRSLSDIRPGDLVLYGTSAGNSTHVGVVVEVDGNGLITTIEGNYGNAVTKVTSFSPYGAHPGGHGSPIYAVVSPLADSSTVWERSGGPGDEEPDKENCTTRLDTVPGGGWNMTCLEFRKERGWEEVRGVAYVFPARPTVTRAHLNLRLSDLPGSGSSVEVRCESALLDSVRSCATAWRPQFIGAVELSVAYAFNGDTQNRNVGDLRFRGAAQENNTFCGPAAMQAVLSTTGADPVPSQREIADEVGTSQLGTLPTNMAHYGNTIVGYTYNQNYLRNTDEDNAVAIANTFSAVWWSLTTKSQPSILLAKSDYLPWVNVNNGLLRHYVVIHGFSTLPTSGGGQTYRFRVWDPQEARHHYMTIDQMVYAMRNAMTPGLLHLITPKANP